VNEARGDDGYLDVPMRIRMAVGYRFPTWAVEAYVGGYVGGYRSQTPTPTCDPSAASPRVGRSPSRRCSTTVTSS